MKVPIKESIPRKIVLKESPKCPICFKTEAQSLHESPCVCIDDEKRTIERVYKDCVCSLLPDSFYRQKRFSQLCIEV